MALSKSGIEYLRAQRGVNPPVALPAQSLNVKLAACAAAAMVMILVGGDAKATAVETRQAARGRQSPSFDRVVDGTPRRYLVGVSLAIRADAPLPPMVAAPRVRLCHLGLGSVGVRVPSEGAGSAFRGLAHLDPAALQALPADRAGLARVLREQGGHLPRLAAPTMAQARISLFQVELYPYAHPCRRRLHRPCSRASHLHSPLETL